MAGQEPHRNQIDQQADDGNGEHAQRRNLLRLVQAHIGLVEDVEGNAEQKQRVERRRQYLETRITIGSQQVGRAAAKMDRQQRDCQSHRVGQHVHGVSISARLPVTKPPTSSTTKKKAVRPSAIQSRDEGVLLISPC